MGFLFANEYRHTAWSVYNAYTELLDHDKPTRKGTDRPHWSWYGPGQDKRLRAIGWFKNFIGYHTLPEVETVVADMEDGGDA